MKARLAVTPGDPRGVGPEVALEALVRFSEENDDVDVVVVGPDGDMTPEELARVSEHARSRRLLSRATSAEAGNFAAASIECAVRRALAGELHAVVTAPLHKPSLRAAGHDVPGQTEMLAGLAGVDPVGMLMTAERTRLESPLRVLLATTHLPLSAVPTAVTTELLVDQIGLLHNALQRDWAVPDPRIGLCALNPHASDGGLFGQEEARVFEPAIKLSRRAGVDVTGPLPADTVFARALAAEFHAVVAPYHDVGMAAFKTVSFGSGVNVTLGLPFIRTSPDHGTAFDIAGTGEADESSMLEAIRLASTLAGNRFDTSSTDV